MELNDFLKKIDGEQKEFYKTLKIFNIDYVNKWDLKIKQEFIRVLYHCRGHFDRVLWQRLNYAPNFEKKLEILKYIGEEAGIEFVDNKKYMKSHECLYLEFANFFSLDLNAVFTENNKYQFTMDFNYKLINWFLENNWDRGSLGFCAYERLDNIDYQVLYDVAISMGCIGSCLGFFKVHKDADHYDKTSKDIEKFWRVEKEVVIDAFSFIYENQKKLWYDFDKYMETYINNFEEDYKTVGNFSHIKETEDLLFLSGQGPSDLSSNHVYNDLSFEEQTKLTLDNIKRLLRLKGLTLRNIVRLDVFITDFNNWDSVNKIIGEYFGSNFPVRQVIGVNRLYKDIGVEITAIVSKN
jgi:reactive intermediate/imine deaminase